MDKHGQLAGRLVGLDGSFRARPGILAGQLSPDIAFPVFADRATGAYVHDIEGNSYLDFIMAFGAIILGHADQGVDDAVITAIRRGVSPTLHSCAQLQLAELIRSTVPGAEMVAMLRTGSDATTAAVRISRAYTGRPHVLRWGYNGWHDWCAPRGAGIPPEIRRLASTFNYGDLSSLEAALQTRPSEVAGVIMMPLEIEVPPPNYLSDVAALTRRYGALLVFDEVRTGFRLAPGGAQEHFGVQADLATFSKAMANGYSISAVTGPARIMKTVEDISMSSIFFRSTDGIAAAIATIERLHDGTRLRRIWALGKRFMAGLSAAAVKAGLPARAVGLPPMPFIEFEGLGERHLLARQAFAEAMLLRGVLIHPNHHWFICDAMTENDIDMAVRHAEAAFVNVKQVLDGINSQNGKNRT